MFVIILHETLKYDQNGNKGRVYATYCTNLSLVYKDDIFLLSPPFFVSVIRLGETAYQ